MEISDVLNNLPADMREDLATSLGSLTDINNRFVEVLSPNLLAQTDSPSSTLIEESTFSREELNNILTEQSTPATPKKLEEVFEEFEEVITALPEAIKAEALSEFEPLSTEDLVERKDSRETVVEIDVLTNLETTVLSLKAAELESIPVESELRFSGATWYEKVKTLPVTIVGAGGIGSWTALLLSKMGMSVDIIDKDNFDTVNIAGQIFNVRRASGRNKAEEVATLCTEFVPTARVRGYRANIDPENIIYVINESSRIFICAVDNMAARKLIYNRWCESVAEAPLEEKENYLFIDGRLAAEAYQVYAITGTNERAKLRYMQEFFSDEEADELACSFKQTAYMAALLAGRIANNIANFASPKDGIPRVVPFYVEYEAYGFEKVVMYA